MVLEVIKQAPIIKEGVLGKLGGGAGGHKNWKDRYFVLSDHLYYYTDQKAFQKDPKSPLGRVALNAYFVSKLEDSAAYEFSIDAYPKSLVCRAHSAVEMEEWIGALMAPLKELAAVPAAAAPVAAGGAGGAAADVA